MELNKDLTNDIKVVKNDDTLEGKVVAIERSAVYVDLGVYGTGIIYGIEYINAREVIKRINIGDTISAKVVMVENEDGYVELSLKEARQAIIWSEAEEAIKEKRVLDLVVKDANKGGLLVDWQGIVGFLPASQLSAENYPRIDDGDKDKITVELKKMIGKRISMNIISAEPKEGKLIFSQKVLGANETAASKSSSKETATNLNTEITHYVGEEVEGTVTGIVDFGIFVKLSDGIEALVHKSEIDWGLVEDTKNHAKIGEHVRAKVIEIKAGKISLSIKATKENPWKEASNKYNKGDTVSGLVIKFNKHGALVSIEEGVAGLVHMSDFGDEAKMKEKISLGKMYKFEINVFEPNEQKMTLTYKA
jgi:small subunit ribosomal protein S1